MLDCATRVSCRRWSLKTEQDSDHCKKGNCPTPGMRRFCEFKGRDGTVFSEELE